MKTTGSFEPVAVFLGSAYAWSVRFFSKAEQWSAAGILLFLLPRFL